MVFNLRKRIVGSRLDRNCWKSERIAARTLHSQSRDQSREIGRSRAEQVMTGMKFKPARTTRTVVSQRGDIGSDRCRALVHGGKNAVSAQNSGRLQGVRRKRLVTPSGVLKKIPQGRRRTLVSQSSATKMEECVSACKRDLFSHAASTQAAGRGEPRIPGGIEGSKARHLVLGSNSTRLSGRRVQRPIRG